MTEDASNSNSNSNRNLLNKLLNKSLNTYIVRSFSIPKDKLPTFFEFSEIVKREGKNFSEGIVTAISEYAQRHRAGNPQLLMSNYVKPEEAQPMRVLCSFIDGALSDGQVHCRRAGLWVPGVRCYSCNSNRLRKK